MSKRSARKSQSRSHRTSKSQPYSRSVAPPKKVRGGWLTAVLILIIIHGVFTSVLLLALRKQPGEPAAPWLWAAAILIGLADIIAAILMWFWKRWGLYLYVVSTLAGIVVGVLMLSSQMAAFHGLVPLLILSVVLQTQNKLRLLE